MPEAKISPQVSTHGPEWLTKDYIEDKLRKYYDDDKVQLLSFKATAACGKGENYVGVMTRLAVELLNAKQQRQQASYLVKCTFDANDPATIVFNEYGLYKRELDMYDILLPKISQVLSEIGDLEKLHADAIYVDYDRSSIILEDLSLAQYVNVSRIQRLDMEHTKLTLKKLAKFHAAGAVLNERSPGIFTEYYDTGFFARNSKGYTPVMQGLCRALIRYVQRQPQLKHKYASKLQQVCDNFMEYGARAFDVNDDDFMTLTHGDIWTTNIMFRYGKDKTLNDVIAIDYQFSTWGSPAIDLHYFFNTSLREELRREKLPELVQYYYYVLADTLKQLKFKGHVPSLFEFQLQYERRQFLALFAALLFQPLMIYNGAQEANFNNILLETEAAIRLKDSIYENPIIQKSVERLLPLFDAKGLFDVMD